ncbi:unnamed protein product [Linum tenue]|uniref:Uncharacterized protein n=1 Tax=Linum tenue TaxID=586396 RepID=A0AAV0LCF5_9ROSI|nr:unnamed protein product [Linum tenue]
MSKFWSTYKHVMIPMAGLSSWEPSEYEPLLPPAFHRMPGRPKKKRIITAEERENRKKPKKQRVYSREELLAPDKNDPSKLCRAAIVITCKECRAEGHNIRTCPVKKAKQMGGSTNSQGIRLGMSTQMVADVLQRHDQYVALNMGHGGTQESSTTTTTEL